MAFINITPCESATVQYLHSTRLTVWLRNEGHDGEVQPATRRVRPVVPPTHSTSPFHCPRHQPGSLPAIHHFDTARKNAMLTCKITLPDSLKFRISGTFSPRQNEFRFCRVRNAIYFHFWPVASARKFSFCPSLAYGTDCIQVCALNGYNCVDTEYAWYQQQQQQRKSPYTSVLMAEVADLHEDSADKPTFLYPATPVDYCPGCVALCAAEPDTAAVSVSSEAAVNG